MSSASRIGLRPSRLSTGQSMKKRHLSLERRKPIRCSTKKHSKETSFTTQFINFSQRPSSAQAGSIQITSKSPEHGKRTFQSWWHLTIGGPDRGDNGWPQHWHPSSSKEHSIAPGWQARPRCPWPTSLDSIGSDCLQACIAPTLRHSWTYGVNANR